MSVASQIQRIKDAVADAYDSVEEKGGTLPATENVANLATAIDSIQSGGGSQYGSFVGNQHEIVMNMTDPSNLIVSLLATNYGESGPVTIDWGDGSTTTVTQGGGDPVYYVANNCDYWTHTYQSVGRYTIRTNARLKGLYRTPVNKLIVNGADYLEELHIASCNFVADGSNCKYLKSLKLPQNIGPSDFSVRPYFSTFKCVVNDVIEMHTTNATIVTNGLFVDAGNYDIDLVNSGSFAVSGGRWSGVLTAFRSITVDSGDYSLTAYAFNSASRLVKIVGFTKLTLPADATVFFGSCTSLRELPDVIDATSCTTGLSFADLSVLKKFPTHLTSNIGFSFANSVIEFAYKETLAEFDANGNIIGGMIYNINTCTAETAQTITLNGTVKKMFTAEQREAIGNELTDKNWTLAW